MFEHLFARHDGLDILRLALAGSSAAVALVYLRFVGVPSSRMRTALKTLTVGALTLLPLTYIGGGSNTGVLMLLALALSLCALGDFFLALEDQGRFFVPGLASFLAGHIAYVAVMLPFAGIPHGASLAIALVVLGAAATLVAWLLPVLGRMRSPVLAYFCVIMVMVATALSVPAASWALGAGAVLFAISDSLIAVRKFAQPFPYIDAAVWITYVLAQFMIVASLLAVIVPAGYPS